jgi:probable rRNA maturation factor
MRQAFVDIVQTAACPGEIDRDRLQVLLERVLDKEQACGEVTVLLADDETLQLLISRFRSIDAPTDVLSFDLKDDGQTSGEIGEIYISLDRARVQAAERGASLSDEVDLLAVHGVLHLLGFDHDTAEARQDMQHREQHHLGDNAPQYSVEGG